MCTFNWVTCFHYIMLYYLLSVVKFSNYIHVYAFFNNNLLWCPEQHTVDREVTWTRYQIGAEVVHKGHINQNPFRNLVYLVLQIVQQIMLVPWMSLNVTVSIFLIQIWPVWVWVKCRKMNKIWFVCHVNTCLGKLKGASQCSLL